MDNYDYQSFCNYAQSCYSVEFFEHRYYKAKRLAKKLAVLAAVGWSLLAANLVLTYIVN